MFLKYFLGLLFLSLIFGSTIQAQDRINCSGSLPSRLTVGQDARVVPTGTKNNIREVPESSQILGQIPAGGAFRVLEGVVCGTVNGKAWWRVEYLGTIGWTAESDLTEYWLEPISNNFTESTQECPNTPPSFLAVGRNGKALIEVSLRQSPSVNGNKSRNLLVGEEFTIIGGSVCSDGYTWWNIRTTSGEVGWSAEGDSSQYYLKALTASLDTTSVTSNSPSISKETIATATSVFASKTDTNDQSQIVCNSDNPTVAFISYDENDAHLSYINPDLGLSSYRKVSSENFTSGVRWLTGFTFSEWSRDGSMIAVNGVDAEVIDDNNVILSSSYIFVMQADGSNQRRLAVSEDSESYFFLRWSPDGKEIVFSESTQNNTQALTIVNVANDTKRQIAIFESVQPIGWTPDGSKILFVTNELEDNTIYSIQPDGTNIKPFLSSATDFIKWSPDGSHVLFTQKDAESDGTAIFIGDSNGKSIQQITDYNNQLFFGDLGKVDWLPNSEQIIFVEDTEHRSEIFVINGDGSNLSKIYDREGTLFLWGFLSDRTQLLISNYDEFGIASLNIETGEVRQIATHEQLKMSDSVGILSPQPCNQPFIPPQSSDTTVDDIEIVCDYDSKTDNLASASNQRLISSGGRYIVFDTTQDNPMLNDTNGFRDVYVYDRHTCNLNLISKPKTSLPSNANSEPEDYAISSDGRYVVFASSASNLVDFDSTKECVLVTCADLFIRDLVTGETKSIILNSPSHSTWEYMPSISSDGNYVAFTTDLKEITYDGLDEGQDYLMGHNPRSIEDVFVHGGDNEANYRASITYNGQPTNGDSTQPFISGNGKFVVFTSSADNLVPNDTNSMDDIFLYTVRTDIYQSEPGQVMQVSTLPDGTKLDGNSWLPSISADGRYVAFVSTANNLASDFTRVCDTNNDGSFFDTCPQVYVKDLKTGVITRVNTPQDVRDEQGKIIYEPTISATGNSIKFVRLLDNSQTERIQVIPIEIDLVTAFVDTKSDIGFTESSAVPLQNTQLYSEPSIYGTEVGEIFESNPYRIIGKNGNSLWLKIETKDTQGWVCRQNIDDNGLVFTVGVADISIEDCNGNNTDVPPPVVSLECSAGWMPDQAPFIVGWTWITKPELSIYLSDLRMQERALVGQLALSNWLKQFAVGKYNDVTIKAIGDSFSKKVAIGTSQVVGTWEVIKAYGTGSNIDAIRNYQTAKWARTNLEIYNNDSYTCGNYILVPINVLDSFSAISYDYWYLFLFDIIPQQGLYLCASLPETCEIYFELP